MISGRTKRVLVYTASLLLAPLPVMPYVRGTREYTVAVCGSNLTLSSLYVVRGEARLKARSLLGNKLLAASLITSVFGMLMLLGSIVRLSWD